MKTNEVKPLFKVGDKVCQKKDRDFVVTINSITNGLYLCDVYDKDGDYDDDYCFSVSEQDQWALVDKCQGCNNVKGCVTCHDGDQNQALDAEVTHGKNLTIPSLAYFLDKNGLDFGDKVKVIIIKEK